MKKKIVIFSILFSLFGFFISPRNAYGGTTTRDQCDLNHCGSPLDVRSHWPGKTCSDSPPDTLHTICCYEWIRDPTVDWGWSTSKWCAPEGEINAVTCGQDTCTGDMMSGFSCSTPGCVPDLDYSSGAVVICRGCIPEALAPSQPSIGSKITGATRPETCGENGIKTAIGCIPTDPKALIGKLLTWGISMAGGISFLLMLWAGFQFITSTGNPEKLQEAQSILTSAIAGLLLVIFSVFLLRLIGVTVLGIPGFK